MPRPHQQDRQAPDIETGIRRRHSTVRKDVPDGRPITLLHIGAEQTVVATGRGTEAETVLTLSIGSRKTADDYFKHNPPTPEELESAIVAVEDEVIRAQTMHAEGATLFTMDTALHEIELRAGASDRPECLLTLDALERTFGRLAAVTLGRPASQEGIPDSPAFAARLLILREFMHHLKFSSITIKA